MTKGKRTNKTAVALMPFIALLLLTACGSDSSDNAGAGGNAGAAGSGGSSASGGVVTGTVSYSGSAHGDLIVSAFADWPAAGPPEAFVKISSPSFPQAYELGGLMAGDYYIFAFIDVPPASPTMPGSEDVQSAPVETVHVVEAASATADVALPAE